MTMTIDEPLTGPASSVTLLVQGMTCAACVRRIETALQRVNGVTRADVNLVTERATIQGHAPLSALIDAVRGAGYNASPYDPAASLARSSLPRESPPIAAPDTLRRDAVIAWALALPLLALGMSHGAHAFANQPGGRALQLVLATAVVFGPGRRFFQSAWRGLLHRSADMNTLVALGAGAAWLYSAVVVLFPSLFPHAEHGVVPHVYFDAAGAVIAFVLGGKVLEARARGHLSDSVRSLVALVPAQATRVGAGGALESVAVESLSPGDRVLVRPGERAPVDGVVEEGVSAFDEALLTGESVPVEKAVGDTVLGGALNHTGAVRIRATGTGADTTLARIARAVEDAQGSKAPIARLADRVSGVFVPVVLVLAVIAFGAWAWINPTAEGITTALERFVTVLIIACPCALGIATPAAVAVGTGRGAQLGVLVKGGAVLETLSRVDTVFLDKTGTLTQGTSAVTDVIAHDPSRENEILRLAASAEQASEHPLARAVVLEAQRRGLALESPSSVQATVGAGLSAMVGGVEVQIGTASFVGGEHVLRAERQALEAEGKTPLVVQVQGEVVAVLGVMDPPAAEAASAVRALHAMGLETAMLSGDRSGAAEFVARAVGVRTVHSEVRPAQKSALVREAHARGRVVAMVGDGINDTPALAGADVGIAMGHGADAARATADVVLLSGGIAALPRAVALAHATLRTIKQNLFWAFLYNLVGIPLAAGVLYPWTGWLLSPVYASAAMSLSSVSVIANSLRLRGFGRPGR